MKIGCCAGGIVAGDGIGVAAAPQLAHVGFDYVELGLAPIAALTDEEFEKTAQQMAAASIPAEACNIFFPRTVRLTGPDVSAAQIEDYATRAIGRAARLGVKAIVLGSGGSRNIPEGFPREKAWQQMVEACRLIAPIATAHKVTIVIEPLNTRESNIITTAAEGLKLAREVDRPSIKLLVDYYHMSLEHESPNILCEARDMVQHLHIAFSDGRGFPTSPEPGFEPFFANLKAINYPGRISIEGKAADFATDAPAALAVLRELAA